MKDTLFKLLIMLYQNTQNELRLKTKKALQFLERLLLFGWKTGFEPATLGTTNQCSNQLSYNHRVTAFCNACANVIVFNLIYKDFFNIFSVFEK